jgi:hypothetical protein
MGEEQLMTEILFDFYEILVQNIFGSVGMAIMGVALVIFLILIITRCSPAFIIYWMLFYFAVMGGNYLGALGILIVFVIAMIYTAIAAIRYGRMGE